MSAASAIGRGSSVSAEHRAKAGEHGKGHVTHEGRNNVEADADETMSDLNFNAKPETKCRDDGKTTENETRSAIKNADTEDEVAEKSEDEAKKDDRNPRFNEAASGKHWKRGHGKPCDGSVGKADYKTPKGQKLGDKHKGYECDDNNGIGKGNPAHSACKVARTEVKAATQTRSGDTANAAPTTEIKNAQLAHTGVNVESYVFWSSLLMLIGVVLLWFGRMAALSSAHRR